MKEAIRLLIADLEYTLGVAISEHDYNRGYNSDYSDGYEAATVDMLKNHISDLTVILMENI